MTKQMYIAGGCFWGLEELFRGIKGVVDTEAGYCGGENDNPTYQNHPGHAETLLVEYDPEVVSYKELLDWFFRVHNPTTLNQQGNDIGSSYRSAIFYQTDEEKQIAEEMIEIVNESGRWEDPVVTTLEPYQRFWAAEPEHQDYLQRYPSGYTCHAVYFDTYL